MIFKAGKPCDRLYRVEDISEVYDISVGAIVQRTYYRNIKPSMRLGKLKLYDLATVEKIVN